MLLGIILLSSVCLSEQFSLIPSIFSSQKAILQEPSVNLTDVDDTKLTTVLYCFTFDLFINLNFPVLYSNTEFIQCVF